MTMEIAGSEPKAKSHIGDIAFLFGYAAATLAVVSGVRYIQSLPDHNAHQALREVVGTQNLHPKGGLNQEFAASLRSKVMPHVTQTGLPGFDRERVFIHPVRTFNIEMLDTPERSVPVSVTSAFPNAGNLYYSIPYNGRQTLVQCDWRQWVRVQIAGFVSQQPATLSEVMNGCNIVGNTTNPMHAKRMAASQFETPTGLRDEAANALQQIVQYGDVLSSDPARINVLLDGFGIGNVVTEPMKTTNVQVQLFMDGKLLTCEKRTANITEVKLPGRKTVADMADGFRVRDFVTLQFCG